MSFYELKIENRLRMFRQEIMHEIFYVTQHVDDPKEFYI